MNVQFTVTNMMFAGSTGNLSEVNAERCVIYGNTNVRLTTQIGKKTGKALNEGGVTMATFYRISKIEFYDDGCDFGERILDESFAVKREVAQEYYDKLSKTTWTDKWGDTYPVYSAGWVTNEKRKYMRYQICDDVAVCIETINTLD